MNSACTIASAVACSSAELETRAIGMLHHAAPRMLLIDEIQHLLSYGLRDQRAALNAIEFLANKLHISIVAVDITR
jgi:hypothetical protein